MVALTNKFPDIGETLSDFHAVEKANNRQMFTILQNIRYLARQGIPFRGNDDEGNFDQLLKRCGENDSRVEGWLKKKSKSYTHGRKYTKRMSATNGLDNSTRNFGQYPERSILHLNGR